MSVQNKDTVEPAPDWQFDAQVAQSFDDMLARSIPQYEAMRRAVFDFQRAFMPREGGRLTDLGTSRGESVAGAIDHFGSRADFLLVDESKPMIEEVRRRYSDRENITIQHYTYEDVSRKKESLEGVLVPVTARWNEQMLEEAGFRHVDCFWRWMKFAGWVAVK